MAEIICYCAEISSNEIKQAVENGCKTIADVRNFLNKHTTGNCKQTAPDGKCCHVKFKNLIKKYISMQTPKPTSRAATTLY